MLSISALNHYYGESQTLWDLNLEVPQGSCVCIMGRNGAGKTTLLKSIMGLFDSPNSQGKIDGIIKFKGVNITSYSTEMRVMKGIGYVPQERDIFPQLTVIENLKTGLRVAHKKGNKNIFDQVYECFPKLKNMPNKLGGNLSGGDQQQLAIARALVLQPELLILDEPTEGLQPNLVSELTRVISRLNRHRPSDLQSDIECRAETNDAIYKISKELKVTVILVEHKIKFARRVANQFCILDRGHNMKAGAMSDLTDTMIQEYLTA